MASRFDLGRLLTHRGVRNLMLAGAGVAGLAMLIPASPEGEPQAHAEGAASRPATGPAPAKAPEPHGAQPRKVAQQSAPSPEATPIKRVLKIDGPFRHGDYVWDDAGVPDGPVFITVDTVAQTLSVFRAGYEIGAAVVLYGADDKPTPTGRYTITEKDADHVSNLYDAPMPYMLRLTNDGISIHGSEVEWGSATHGCIGVPTAFARKLFNAVKLGDPVIVTSGRMMSGIPAPKG